MANAFFPSNAGMYLGGDDWNDHGSSNWAGSAFNSELISYGGRLGTRQIIKLLDSKLKTSYHDGTMLLVGATPVSSPTAYGSPGCGYTAAYSQGWPVRWAQTGGQLDAVFRGIMGGDAPPRIFYFAGDNSGDDWGSNPSVIPVIAQYGSLLRDIVNKRQCALYCHTTQNYNDWLPTFTNNSVVARFDTGLYGNLMPTEFGLTQPYLENIDTPALRNSVPFHNWFATVDPNAEFSVLIQSESTFSGVQTGTDSNGQPIYAPADFHLPVGISGFAGLGQTIEVDPTRVHFW